MNKQKCLNDIQKCTQSVFFIVIRLVLSRVRWVIIEGQERFLDFQSFKTLSTLDELVKKNPSWFWPLRLLCMNEKSRRARQTASS